MSVGNTGSESLMSAELWLKATAYCAVAEHCPEDLRHKLLDWGAQEAVVEEIVGRLLQEDFINEGRYCCAFVNDKFRYNKWGRMKIAYQLRRKGLPDEDIRNALESIDEEEYESVLMALLRAKMKGLRGRNDYELRGKLYRFAQSRGFEYALTERVCDSIMR